MPDSGRVWYLGTVKFFTNLGSVRNKFEPGMVAHTFNPSIQEVEAGRSLSSRPARATQRNPVSKNKQTNKKQQKNPRSKFNKDEIILGVNTQKGERER